MEYEDVETGKSAFGKSSEEVRCAPQLLGKSRASPTALGNEGLSHRVIQWKMPKTLRKGSCNKCLGLSSSFLSNFPKNNLACLAPSRITGSSFYGFNE